MTTCTVFDMHWIWTVTVTDVDMENVHALLKVCLVHANPIWLSHVQSCLVPCNIKK